MSDAFVALLLGPSSTGCIFRWDEDEDLVFDFCSASVN